MGQSIKAWIAATVVVAFLIVLVGWFLFISPSKAATSEVRGEIESEVIRTATLTEQLKVLSTQYDNLDETLAALDDVTAQVPTTAEASSFRRVIVDNAATSGVTITELSSGSSTAVTPPAVVAPDTTTSDTGDTADSGDAAVATPSPSPVAEDTTAAAMGLATESGQILVGIPVDITVVGTYDASRAFIASLQGTEGRLFLVYAFNVVTQSDAPANGGRPETVSGDVEVFIQGYLVVLTPPTSSLLDDVILPEPAELPSTERNPFIPLAQPAP